ncbi:MAG: hypothetical protein ACFFG0_43655 [Candidatus Thorarchaeota archaeon]
MLNIIDGNSGFLEINKIIYNDLGHNIELFRKLDVLNKLDIPTENY